MPEARPDVVIFAPLKLEVLALCDQLNCNYREPQSLAHGVRFYSGSVQGTSGRELGVRVVELLYQGVLHASVVATTTLEHWKPWCAISFGIAGGFVGDDVNIGDVVVADEIFYYEPAKETGQRPTATRSRSASSERKTHRSRGARRWSATVLESRLRPFVPSPSVMQLVMRVAAAGGFDYTLRHGPVASGEKLIADIDAPSRKAILKLNSKMLGVEMEAAGVAAAVRWGRNAQDVAFIAIKGISDDASTKKGQNSSADSRNRKRAASNAADFTARVLAELASAHVRRGLNISRTPVPGVRARIRECLPPNLVHPPRLHEINPAIFPLDENPPIYYHWRVFDGGLNWVDYIFLRIMRDMSAVIGCLVMPLATDMSNMNEATRSRLNSLVTLISGAAPVWHDEMMTRRGEYAEAASACGMDAEVVREIRAAKAYWGFQDGNLVSEEWLHYVAWHAEPFRRLAVLVWDKHWDIYASLLGLWNIRAWLIRTKDVSIDRELGKFSQPWSGIHVDPPKYESLWQALDSQPSEKAIWQFLRYATRDQCRERRENGSEIDEFRSRYSQASKIFDRLEHAPNGAKLLRGLQLLVSEWEQVFSEHFGSTGAARQ